MTNAEGRHIMPEDYKRWEMGLKQGDLVQARWTRNWNSYVAKAVIHKFNLCSAQVILQEDAAIRYREHFRSPIWRQGNNRTIALRHYNGPLRYSRGLEIYKEGAEIYPSKWSDNSGLFPLE